MIRFPKHLVGSFLALSLIITGCQTQEATTLDEPAPTEDVTGDEAPDDAATDDDGGAPTAPSAEAPDADDPPTAAQSDDATGEDADLTAVSIYTMDDQCNEYEQSTIRVSRDQAMSQAIGQVISSQKYEAFELAGYRVNYDADEGTAVVDLRLDPDSERQFVSLSSCEQRSLFGSVEETLMKNPDWSVTSVEFTNRGEELLL
ncbi:MAG: hypothetical protein AAFR15_02585 [Cyanobacteria bacterium J06627_15]